MQIVGMRNTRWGDNYLKRLSPRGYIQQVKKERQSKNLP